MSRACRNDSEWQTTTEQSGRVTRGGQEETRESKTERGGLSKRVVRKAGEEEDWKKKTRDRGGWKILSDEAVTKLRSVPHP